MGAIISFSRRVISWSNTERLAKWHNIIAVAKTNGFKILGLIRNIFPHRAQYLFISTVCASVTWGNIKLFTLFALRLIILLFFLCLLKLFIHSSCCLSFQPGWKRRTTVLQAKQTASPPLWHCLVKKRRPTRFKIHWGCNLHAKAHQFFMALTLWALTARRG